MSGYLFTDTETTGLEGDVRITQLASIRTDLNLKVRGVFYSHVYLPPDVEISDYVKNLTGLTHEHLKNEPNEENVLSAWLDFSITYEDEDDLIFAGFNAAYDLRIICARLNAIGLYERLCVKTPGYCVMKHSKEMLPNMPERVNEDGTISRYKLELVGPYLGIHGKRQHNALSDITQTFNIARRYRRMKSEVH